MRPDFQMRTMGRGCKAQKGGGDILVAERQWDRAALRVALRTSLWDAWDRTRVKLHKRQMPSPPCHGSRLA